jgi:hypothetical protein
MAKGSNLVKMAKTVGKKANVAEKPVEEVVEKPKTAEEERDLKAKAKVEELLQGVDLSLTKENKEEELLEVESVDNKSTEWLEEQISLLSGQVETLRSELAQSKDDYAKVFALYQQIKSGAGVQDDGDVKQNAIKLFVELQNAHLSMGFNPQTHAPNLIIAPIAFMNKLIVFFPFLAQYKKF